MAVSRTDDARGRTGAGQPSALAGPIPLSRPEGAFSYVAVPAASRPTGSRWPERGMIAVPGPSKQGGRHRTRAWGGKP